MPRSSAKEARPKSSSSSKLDYLSSKYLEKPRKKKKEASKKSHSRKESKKRKDDHRSVRAAATHDGSSDDSNSEKWTPTEIQSEAGDESDEGPVVVVGVDLPLEPSSRRTSDPRGNQQAVVEEGQRGGTASGSAAPPPKRRRSSDSDIDGGSANRRRLRRRYDSDEDDGRIPATAADLRSRSNDDSSASSSASPQKPRAKRRRRRYDSENDDNDDEPHARRRGQPASPGGSPRSSESFSRSGPRRRYDSSVSSDGDDRRTTSTDNARPKRYDSDDAGERMSSGHRAGLQTARTFAQREAALGRRRRAEAQATLDRHGAGETVYRNARDGVRREVEGLPQKPSGPTEAEIAALNTGRVQREAETARRLHMEELAQSTFARHADDARLEELRKNAVREGDPMAAAAASSSRAPDGAGVAALRPVYKGPPAKPNRFSIRPGYRWDGVDRSNGFEDRLLTQKYSLQLQKEQAYRLSSADM